MARQELRRSQQRVGPFGFRVSRLPRAAAYLGWPSEALLGMRCQFAQLALLSGWKGSASSLVGAVALAVPLIVARPLGNILHALLTPLLSPIVLCLTLLDEAAVLLSAAMLSALSTVVGAIVGGGAGAQAAMEVGPRAIVAFSALMRRERAVRLAFTALYSILWTPLKEEALFRGAVQRALCGRRLEADEEQWRRRQRRARWVSSLAFGLGHLPAQEAAGPLLFALPLALSATLSSFFCFGMLYERRGLAAAVGAHAAHNLAVSTLHALPRTMGRLLANTQTAVAVATAGDLTWVRVIRTLALLAAAAVPVAIYANAWERFRHHRTGSSHE